MSDYEQPECYVSSARRARKSYRCCECSRGIAAGDTYQIHTGRWDKEWDTYRRCARCERVAVALLADGLDDLLFGGVRDVLAERSHDRRCARMRMALKEDGER